jgi:hypothetical protein
MAEKDLTLRFKVTDEGTVVLDKISQKISQVGDSAKGMSSSLNLIKWDAIVNFGSRAITAGEQVYDFARSVASSAMEIQKQSTIMGVSTEVYQKLGYAAKMADVSTEEFTRGMKFLSRSIEEAKSGTGDAGRTFKALGIDVGSLSEEEMTLQNVTYLLADAFRGLSDGSAKVDASMVLMGRSGQAMIPYFNLGAEAIKNFGEKAERMGSILGDVVLAKGSEAELIFIELGISMNALKISLAPLALEFAKLAKGVSDATIELAKFASSGKTTAEVVEDMKTAWFGGWEDWATAPKKALEKLPDLYDTFGYEFEKFAGNIKAVDERLLIELKRAPEGAKEAANLMKEWLTNYRVDIDELNDAMSVLGTKSTRGQLTKLEDQKNAFKTIEAQFNAGTASALDYANAIKALTQAYNSLTGGDTTKALMNLEEQTSQAMAAVDKTLPDWQKTMGKIVDAWIVKRNEIMDKDPIYIMANLDKYKATLAEAESLASATAERIRAMDMTPGGGGGGSSSGYASGQGIIMPGMEGFEERVSKEFRVDFTATGMSPKMPLGDALKKLIEKFGGIDEMIQGMEANISFEQSSYSLKQLEKKLKLFESYRATMVTLAGQSGASTESKLRGYDPSEMAKIAYLINDVKEQIKMLKDQMDLDVLKSYAGSYQMGTHYVPRTGLALVHQGERIIPKNVRYGDSNTNTNTFYISGNDPKKIADEVAKVLQYGRSGNLAKSIRSLG